MKKIFTSFMLIVCIICASVLGACGGSKELKSISVTTMPKTQYEIGDKLDLTGGEITATYSDNSTEKVSLSDSSVTIQRPNMNTEGEKTVSVTYNSVSTTFKITVSKAKLNFTFDMNYDGAEAQTVKVEPGTAATPITDPEREGYVFLGWYVGEGASAKFNFETVISAATTVYAHWGYSVTFDLNYTGATNSVEKVEAGAKVTRPANPERADHMFTGWFTENGGDTEFDFNSAINANTTLYAGWIELGGDTEVFTVTFDYNDNYRSETKSVIGGAKVTAVAAPTITDATFVSWCIDKAGENAYDFNTPVTADITLYAKWDVDKYTAYFHINHADNGNIVEVNDIRVGDRGVINPPEEPVLSGYYFAGWYEEASCETKVSFPVKGVYGFNRYYAKWQKEWEFQAEYTDFGDREAFGYSANGTGASAFINKNGAELWGAHNGYWVANLHNKGLYVEFIIESDAEVFDAALVLRLSADFYDITLTKDNFGITINGEEIDYEYQAVITGAVAPDQGGIQNKRPFDNWKFLDDVHLVKGTNTIRFTMLDSQRYGEVGTMYATAPMMDSIYVNCNANLTWNPILGNV